MPIFLPFLPTRSFLNLRPYFNYSFISKLVDRIFHESLPRARKESQTAQQASAGYALSMNPLLVIRKAQRGRDT
ncbi:MAG: hypothetical protein AMJ94_14200 [Deltaproteobacteria bacterium SM23_61]|nr:MAG: hypothetical protein AMJ94_14200 [Deltaproteobacteria bacterium SM23_61]